MMRMLSWAKMGSTLCPLGLLVTGQTSVMIKKLHYKDENEVAVGEANEGDVDVPETEEHAPKLTWTWTPEAMTDTLQGKGRFRATILLDQKEATFDISDRLCADINNTMYNSWKNATLRVSTNGHATLAYVNKKLIGYQFSKQANGKQMVKGNDYSFVLEKPVSLNPGANTISLLSASVGLANYGEKYHLRPTGLAGGSVQLVNDAKNTIDLTSGNWFYKVI
ncbi:hypothetical protein DITRI_Ditri10aG0095200 [Diplodiscus trichospermus]